MSEAPKRVVILQARAENGGTQEVGRRLADGLRRRGHAVHEIFFFVRPGSVFRGDEHTIQCLEAPPATLQGRIRLVQRMIEEVRRLKPHVVLGMQWDANLLVPLVARRARVAATIANELTAPLMMPGWVRLADRLQGSLGCFTRIVTNTRMMMAAYAAYPPRYRGRLSLIEHGIQPKTSPLTRTQARAAFGLQDTDLLLGSLGRLDPQKNFAAAVRILAGRERWHLAIAGQGKEGAQLTRLAEELGCGRRLHLVGEVTPQHVGDFLAALDLFVFPTLSESFGLAAVEAAQAGVPTVVNDIEVMREVLTVDGEACALFVDAADTAAFAAAVEGLFAGASARERLSALGRKLSQRYDIEAMCDGYDQLIAEIT